jgi:hypothetical protein
VSRSYSKQLECFASPGFMPFSPLYHSALQ